MKRILLVLCSICILLTGCSKSQDEGSLGEEIGFFDKYAIKELDDGWYMCLYIEVLKDDETKKEYQGNYSLENISSVFMDVLNLKYQSIPGFYVSVEDRDGKEVGQIDTVMPSYIQSRKYKKEMQTISKFLSNKKFKKNITEQDLVELKTSEITKEEIVELYNQALKNDPKEDVNEEYDANLECNLVQKVLLNQDILQFAYIDAWNQIAACELEYIYKDGTHLSDIVANGQANAEQMSLYQELEAAKVHVLAQKPLNELKINSNEDVNDSIESLIYEAIHGNSQ